MDRKIILENGIEMVGKGFGADCDAIHELVFNTSMVGYQEVMSDPSYTDQIVVMTYPLIGNYGVTDEDYESKNYSIGGFIVREYNDKPSNFRYTKTFSQVLEENNIPGICQIDTRKLTRIIRNEGSQKVLITDINTSLEEGLRRIHEHVTRHDQVQRVSSKKIWYSRTANPQYHVVAVDCGIKLNIIRKLNEKGCNVTVVPYDTPYSVIREMNPDGLFLSNGPGNPEDVHPVIQLVKEAQGKLPIFGICLGHQMIALANGLHTYKMKFGHRGGNHPVKNLLNGKIEITSQNHSYAVDASGKHDPALEFTHINLLDQTVEGLQIENQTLFSVQYHPESAPGPQDSSYLFDKFIENMQRFKKGGKVNG